MRIQVFWMCAFIVIHMLGCAIPSGKMRNQAAGQMVKNAGWAREIFHTERFDIAGFRPDHPPSRQSGITIYIEGDGLAWASRSRVSPDPTPVNPVGLKLALRHPGDTVLYLSRPFQFGQTRNKDLRFWTSARFAPQVVDAYLQILDQLKKRYQVHEFQLVGYSGGGAVAALVAAKRKDVTLLVTVAGNLDHRVWTELHGVSPLTGSLNPSDFVLDLKHTAQVHFYGEKDTVVPGQVAFAFASRFPRKNCPKVIEIKDVSHSEGWEGLWPHLFLEALEGS